MRPARTDIVQSIIHKAGGSHSGNVQYFLNLDHDGNRGLASIYVSIIRPDGTSGSMSLTWENRNYPVLAGSWYHLALVFDNGTLRGFINGELGVTQTIEGARLDTAKPGALAIGAKLDTHNQYAGFNGEIDEVRISNLARYNSNFTPASKPFTPDDNSVVLYHFDGNTKDASYNHLDGKIVGDVRFVDSTVIPTPTPEPNAIPVITTTSLPPGILNRQYTATISGYDLDETDILSLSTSGLPAGLRQDKCALSVVYGNVVITCMLTGRPLQTGTYPVTIKLEDNRGGKTTKVLPLRIVRTSE